MIMTDEEQALWRAALEAYTAHRSATQEVLCRAFLARHPGNLPAQALRLHALAALKRFSDCEALILEVGTLTETRDRIIWGRALADYLSRCGRHEEAERVLRLERELEAVEARPGNSAAILVNEISRSLVAQGKLEQALQEIDSFLAEAAHEELDALDHRQMLARRTRVLRALGRFEDALAAFELLAGLDTAFADDEVELKDDLERAIAARTRWWNS